MQITAHLEPHIGLTSTSIGQMQIEHNQWMVFVSATTMAGRLLVGYLGKHEDAKFCPIMSFVEQPLAVQNQIVAAINKAAGRDVSLGIAPLPLSTLETEGVDDDE